MKFSLPKINISFLKRGFIRLLTIIGGFVFFSFFMGMIVGAMTDNRRPSLPDDIILSLELNGRFIEKPSLPSLSNPFPKPNAGTIHQIIRTLDRAATDDRVHGLYIRLENGDYGIGHTQEFRDAIDRFQESGKFAYLYSNSFGGFGSSMGEYYIAATMDEVWMQPVGTLGLTGYSLEMPFMRGALDKIGVMPEVISKGKYKSAPETFNRKNASPDNLAMSRSMLNNLSNQFMDDVALDRGMDPVMLQSLIDQSPMTDHEALKSGLVDSLGYWDEFVDHVEDGLPEKVISVPLGKYARSLKYTSKKKQKFAFIQASGAISSFSEGAIPLSEDTAFAEEIWDAFHNAMNDDSITAIIFRVDSPGGSPTASETIRRALILAKKRKPVIVSMGNMAASGGYWISVNADAIIAQPATLTGSIGVFAIKPNLGGLWDKLDINWQTIDKGENSNIWSTHKGLNEAERRQLQNLIDHTYDQFIERVAEGRGMTAEEAERVSQGRVWTGEQAFDKGLVDELGGMDVAILKTKELVDIAEDAQIALIPFPKPLTPFEQIVKLANETLVAMPGFLKLSSTIDQTISTFKTNDFKPLLK